MEGGILVFGALVLKLGATLAVSTGLITGIKYFNTYEFKAKKKGGPRSVSDDIDSLRERVRPRD